MDTVSSVRQAIREYTELDPFRTVRSLIEHRGWVVPVQIMADYYGTHYSHAVIAHLGTEHYMPPGPLVIFTDLEAAEEAHRQDSPVGICMGGIEGQLLFSKITPDWEAIVVNPKSHQDAWYAPPATFSSIEWYVRRMHYEQQLVRAWKSGAADDFRALIRGISPPFRALVLSNGTLLSAWNAQGRAALVLFTTSDCVLAAYRADGASGLLKDAKEIAVQGSVIDNHPPGYIGISINPCGPGPHIYHSWEEVPVCTREPQQTSTSALKTPDKTTRGSVSTRWRRWLFGTATPDDSCKDAATAIPQHVLQNGMLEATHIVPLGGKSDDADARHMHGHSVLDQYREEGIPFVLYLRTYHATIRHGKTGQLSYLLEEYLARNLPAGVNLLSVQVPDHKGEINDALHHRNTPSLQLGEDWLDVVRSLLYHSEMAVSECLMLSPGVIAELQLCVELAKCDSTVLVLPPPRCDLPPIDYHPLVREFARCIWANQFFQEDLLEMPVVTELLARLNSIAGLPRERRLALSPGDWRQQFPITWQSACQRYEALVGHHDMTDALEAEAQFAQEDSRYYAMWSRYRYLNCLAKQIRSGDGRLNCGHLRTIVSHCLKLGSEFIAPTSYDGAAVTSLGTTAKAPTNDLYRNGPAEQMRYIHGDVDSAARLAEMASAFSSLDPTPMLRDAGMSYAQKLARDVRIAKELLSSGQVRMALNWDHAAFERDSLIISLAQLYAHASEALQAPKSD